MIQRVPVPDFEEYRTIFSGAVGYDEGDISRQMAVMGDFYRLLAQILPTLAHKQEVKHDPRIKRALDHIHLHSEEELSVCTLAAMCNMSVSHFHAVFRKETGMTPIDYKNHILVNRASGLLLCREYESIEDISSVLGFSSSAYFRRVFKKVTGKSPSEYRRTAIEL